MIPDSVHPSTTCAVFFAAAGLLLAPAAGAEDCEDVCNQEYALCIAASCAYGSGNASAVCVCTVESGWSIGPVDCATRAPIDEGSYTILFSTFSTALYDSEPFYEGTGLSADCYGAPCISTDGEVAACVCPVSKESHTYWTEAGSCSAPGDGVVYSGASSPFIKGEFLSALAEKIASCSGESAPTPQSCPQ